MTETNSQFDYEPENTKHVYGKSARWPAEKIVVKHINELHESYPGFKLRLLGTSGVFGEKFPLFFTQCSFTLPNSESVDQCVVALKTSDELIRRRVSASWSWEFAWQKENEIMFFVNWFDFAYFIKNKEIFLGKDHARFALDFSLDVQQMRFEHFKILRDGSFVPFDIKKISPREKEVLENIDRVHFTREFRDPRF